MAGQADPTLLVPDKWSPVSTAGGDEGTTAERFYDSYWDWRKQVQYLGDHEPADRLGVAISLIAGLSGRGSSDELLVDVGCGEGLLGRGARRAGLGYATLGVDVSKTVLQLASGHYDRVAQYDADRAVLDNVLQGERPKVICTLEVLPHLFEPGRLLHEARRLIRDDGLLVASCANFAHYASRLSALRGEFPDSVHIFRDAEHLHYFTKRSLGDAFRSAGFEPVSIEGSLWRAPRGVGRVDRWVRGAVTRRAPTLFAGQLVVAGRPI